MNSANADTYARQLYLDMLRNEVWVFLQNENMVCSENVMILLV